MLLLELAKAREEGVCEGWDWESSRSLGRLYQCRMLVYSCVDEGRQQGGEEIHWVVE